VRPAATGPWDVLVDDLGRLEGPTFDIAGDLWFSDLDPPHRVYRLGADGALDVMVEDRVRVGGMVPHADGGVVMSGPDVSWCLDGEMRPLVVDLPGSFGCNDMTTDGEGRIFVGLFGETASLSPTGALGSLWRIDGSCVATRVQGGVMLPNGMAFSPDGNRLYHVDTGRGLVLVSDAHADGSLGAALPFYALPEGMRPDGIAVDESGHILVAPLTVGAVLRVSSEGELTETIEVPRASVSSLCFGGPDRRDVYVATFGAPFDATHGGAILRVTVDVPGARMAPACVRPKKS
jgi:sugar lactone lactonase YvrE